jgi:hypothetical protein
MTARGTITPSIKGTVKFTTSCPWCHQPVAVDMLDPEALAAYQAGAGAVHDLFPLLSGSEREALMTGTHAKCWEEMWPEEDDDAPAGAPCAECGEPSEHECAACDRPLCEEDARTTAVPGDTFCRAGVGCQASYGA